MKHIGVALSGSGFLAGAEAGAICALLEHNAVIEDVAGTSGGSIVTACTALGFTAPQLRQLAFSTDFSPFLTFNPWTLVTSGSYCSGNALLAWLEKQTQDKTLGETQIPCHIIASDVLNDAAAVFSSHLTPSVKAAFACRASSSVPFIFEKVAYKDTFLVDGGVKNNIPVKYLTKHDNKLNVGFRVTTKDANFASPPWKLAGTLIGMMLDANEDSTVMLGESTGAVVIPIDLGDAWFLNTKLTQQQKESIFNAGYAAGLRALHLL